MILRVRQLLWTVQQGVKDGFAEPYDLSQGLTWDSRFFNETYDHAVNVGQWLGRRLRRP